MIIKETKMMLQKYLSGLKIPLDKVCLSFSGGKDSSVLLKLIELLGYKNKIRVVFFNTGMELDATLEFVDKQISNGWKIDVVRPTKPAPLIYRENGVPFNSKYTSEMIERLQKHHFDINDIELEYDELRNKYPNCKIAINWLTKRNIMLNISNKVKEWWKAHPTLKISNKCCYYLKKQPLKKYIKDNDIQLSISGVRKAEGGIRKHIYKKCFDGVHWYPLLNWTDDDINEFIKQEQVELSKAYTLYGLKRTGCFGCPFSRERERWMF